MLPVPDLDTEPYWEGMRGGELRLQRCDDCGRYQHFPSPICSACLSFALSYVPVEGHGTVYSFVVIHRATTDYFAQRVPYAVAWVELPEQAGLRVLGEIVGCAVDEIGVGMKVRAEFVSLDDTVTVLRFAPTTKGSTQ